MIGKGSKSKEPYLNLGNLTQADIAAYYLNIKSIPSLIHSPLREDIKPSFALYCPSGTEVNFKDFSTGESGTIWTLLTKMWNCSISEAVAKVYNDLGDKSYSTKINTSNLGIRSCKINSNIDLQCKVRDKYAYAYVEFKEGRTTLKIYQPFNKNGYKWSNRHDKSVISLWTKVPKEGKKICICSSLKDALCLWANTGIPALATQGEGYGISNTAINELRRRFTKVYICFDNDDAGLKDGVHLANKTGFINIVLPKFKGGKDISDLYKVLNNKEQFKQMILKLFYDD